MSKPATARPEKRSSTINLRVRKAQRDLIDQAAEAVHKTRSEFMLEAACREAQSVLLDRTHFVVDEETYNEFLRILDAPPNPPQGLRDLMNMPSPWD